jgi:hypothetical protein
MHGLEPPTRTCETCSCLLPSWPINQVLELAPANWRLTVGRPEVQQKLDANVYRQVTLGKLTPDREVTHRTLSGRQRSVAASYHAAITPADVARRTGTSEQLVTSLAADAEGTAQVGHRLTAVKSGNKGHSF